MNESRYKSYCNSPCGLIELSANEKGITSLYFVKKRSGKDQESEIIAECRKQLDEYFHGKRKSFSLPLDLHGTEFQIRVWNELLKIPYGKTISYLQLAKNLGDPKCIRAAGTA
ncbi:MAG TPA: MGMT family protein, partial [Bacteroidia bacterium]